MVPRRTFLALAGAGAMLADKKPLGIGFLGAAHSHFKGKLAVVRESPDWRLIGVSENDSAIQESLRKQNLPLISRDDLLRNPDVQVIAVESAVKDHAADARAALEAGKHLHLEKAPAGSLAEFSEILKLAQRKNLLVQAGYMWRYHLGINKALEAARSGWLGPVHYLKASIATNISRENRAELAVFAGGIMFELGGHVIDPMVRLMGPPKKVAPFLRTDSPFSDTLRDNTLAVMEWEKAIGVVQTSTLESDAFRRRSFEIHGSNGSVIVNPIEPPALQFDLAKPAGPYPAGAQKIPLPDYRRFVDDFAELAAAARGDGKLRVTPEEDLIVQQALLQCSGMS